MRLLTITFLALVACETQVIQTPATGEPAAPVEEPAAPSEVEETTEPSGVEQFARRPITITSEGVDALDGEGGILILAYAGAKRVTASVEADAPKTGPDAPTTQRSPLVTVDEKPSAITVGCTRAGATGLGCKKLIVTVPAGTPDDPVSLTVTSVTGGVRVDGNLTVRALTLTARGTGTIDANVKPLAGATITLTAGGSALVGLPATFATDRVDLGVAGSAGGRIDTSAFPGLTHGQAYGETGAGAKLLTVRSTGSRLTDVVRLSKM